jgi:hypothetical protein
MDGIGAFCGALLLTLFLRPVWYAKANPAAWRPTW